VNAASIRRCFVRPQQAFPKVFSGTGANVDFDGASRVDAVAHGPKDLEEKGSGVVMGAVVDSLVIGTLAMRLFKGSALRRAGDGLCLGLLALALRIGCSWDNAKSVAA